MNPPAINEEIFIVEGVDMTDPENFEGEAGIVLKHIKNTKSGHYKCLVKGISSQKHYVAYCHRNIDDLLVTIIKVELSSADAALHNT